MKNKSPLKTDATLVHGAYRAAAAGIPRGGQDGMSQAMDDIGKMGMDAMNKIHADRKQKRKEGDDLADSILETGGSLGTSWLDTVTGEVEGMHSQYDKDAKWGRKNTTAKGMQDLNTLSSEIATIKDMNAEMAEAQKQKDWSGSVTEKEQGIFNAFMSNDSKKRITRDENGKRVFEIETPDGWKTTADINRMMQDHKKDYATMTDIRQQALDVVDKAKADALRNKEEGYTGGGYDVTKATAKMNNTLRNANLKSLMHDDVLENGKPWVEAVKENPEIVKMTYEELGMKLNADGVMEIDTDGDGIPESSFQDDGDGKISAEEAKTILSTPHKQLIVDALINPENDLYEEERTRGMMASYFTGFVNQNYEQEYAANGGKTSSDAASKYGEGQEGADNFMKEKGII